ncbi:MAG TPA: hypothetical protein VFL95_06650 [Gemmatimonadales bacterium]|nr:hypothetical protein [Gemmatimonadales bacterium]
MTSDPIHCYAVTQPGLEAVTADELAQLGLSPGPVEPGGVPFSAGFSGLYRANLHLRTASRVLIRLAAFHASSFAELERHARRIEWGRVLSEGDPIRLRVTSRKSRLYHQDAIAERLLRAAAAAVPGVHEATANGDEAESESAGQLFVVRVFRDEVTISADSSGALLHRRGYRRAIGPAPLRETLAAALLLAVQWSGEVPLVDPFCGSGTIPIEAALIAAGVAPGRHRPFAFERWPGFDSAEWHRLLAEADSAVRTPAAPIIGGDRDDGAIDRAMANAERAGVTEWVRIERTPFSALELPEQPGWIVTNPPYGIRIGQRNRLRDLYARLGQIVRAHPGWRLAFLSSHPMLTAQVALPLTPLLSTTTGGIHIRLEASQ